MICPGPVSDPGNPTGTALGSETVKDLAAVARAHSLLVLADELLGSFRFEARGTVAQNKYETVTMVPDS